MIVGLSPGTLLPKQLNPTANTYSGLVPREPRGYSSAEQVVIDLDRGMGLWCLPGAHMSLSAWYEYTRLHGEDESGLKLMCRHES